MTEKMTEGQRLQAVYDQKYFVDYSEQSVPKVSYSFFSWEHTFLIKLQFQLYDPLLLQRRSHHSDHNIA